MADVQLSTLVPRSWKRTITPEDYGAVGNGTTNDITALRSVWNNAVSGDRIYFTPGKTYRFEDSGDHLYWNGSGTKTDITIWGYGATVHATLDGQSGWQVESSPRLSVYGIGKTSTWGRNPAVRGSSPHHHGLTYTACDDLWIENINIRGSYAGGLFIDNCDRFVIRHPVIANTSADGLHFTGPSTGGRVYSPTIINPGDDGVATVGYLFDAAPCSDIRVDGARIMGQYNGRGMSILGATNVHYTNFEILASRAAGLYLGCENNGDFSTYGLSNCSVTGGKMIACSQSGSVEGHPAILILNQATTRTVDGLEIGDIHILDVANNQAPVRLEGSSTANITNCTIRDLYCNGKYGTDAGWISTVINKSNSGITTPTTARITAGGKWA